MSIAIRRLIIWLVCICFLSLAFAYLSGYHGERSFARADELPDRALLIKNARKLERTPYDMLQGRFGDIGSKLGLIVCSDVPNIAYGRSGYSLKAMLEKDFAVHGLAYSSEVDNSPRNKFFHRRAKNLFSYFVANGHLMPPNSTPTVGDLAFYRNTTNGGITHVALVTNVENIGYHIMESAPETIFAKEEPSGAPIKRGMILAGFGRMYEK